MQEIDTLIKTLSRLPGFGPRSARRAVLHMLKHKETLLYPLSDSLRNTADKVVSCGTCGNLDTKSPCHICTDTSRDTATICVVEGVADLWAMSRTGTYNGQFHVLGGVLSPMDGITPEDLNITPLITRVANTHINEIILATNLTVEGQSTSHYIAELLLPYSIKITRLAHGVPVGGELDYMDDGTINIALSSRTEME